MSFNSWTPGYTGPLDSLKDQYKSLEARKRALDQARPLPPLTVKSLQDDLRLRYTYNSNAIEGNTLTLQETLVILKDGYTIGGKTIREHLEVINHNDAITRLEELATNKDLIDEKALKDIHSIILRGIDNRNAGNWRYDNVRIMGASHIPPRFELVQDRMKDFFNWYSIDALKLPVVERAARVHIDFVAIHPFIDGNGRTARLLMNLELTKSGYPLAIVPVEERQNYYNNLDQAIAFGNYKPFTEQVCKLVNIGFDYYSKVLEFEKE